MRSLIGGIVNRAPVAFAPRGFNLNQAANRGNPTTQMAAMASVGTLNAIVGALAEATAAPGWHLYRKAPPGTPPEQRVEVTRHLALDVWNKPNPFFTRQELMESCQQHYELTGEGWTVVSKIGTTPMEMWPVRPDRIAPIPSATDYLAGYAYTDPDGGKVPLALDEVIFMRRPNPLDMYRGMGVVQSVLADVDSARYSAEWNRNFFLNSAEPGGIIQVEKRLSDEEFDEMTTRWREQHQGVAQAHRVAVLEQGQWIDRKFTQRDMQFTELRHLSSDMIREAFRVSKTMLGQTEDVNRATAQTAEVVFARWLIVPRLDRWKQALNNDFLPMFGATGRDLEFDYDSPVPEDFELEQTERDSKVNAYVALTGAGVKPAAASEVVGLPEMEHEDPPPAPEPVPVDPTAPDAAADNLTPRQVAGLLAAVGGPHAQHAPPAVHPARDVAPGVIRAVAETPTPPDGIPGRLPAGAGPDLAAVQKSWENALGAVLSTFSDLSEKQRDGLVEQIHQAVQSGDLLALAGLHVASQEGAAALEAAMVALAMDAASQVVAEADRQGVTVGPAAVDRHRTAAVAQVAAAGLAAGLVLSASREALRAWGPKSTPDDVAASVREHLESLTDAQPRLVLGGALTQAQHDGRLNTMLAGPAAAMYADEVLDGATCSNCRAVNRLWVGNSDDPAQPWLSTYPSGGYVDCLGGSRCRGQIVCVWRGGSDWKKWIEMPAQRGDPNDPDFEGPIKRGGKP